MLRTAVWIGFFMAMSVSCLEQPDCYSLNNNAVQLSFKKLADNSADAILFQEVIALDAQKPLLAAQTVSAMNLPLNYLATETTFIFKQADGTDTLIVDYLSRAQFVSDSCGQRFVLSDLVIKHHSFDSVRVLSNVPFKASTTPPKANFVIYREQ